MLRTLRPLTVLAALLALGACGGGSNGTTAVATNGTGFSASVSAMAFSTTQTVGTSSAVQSVTLTNNTSSTVTVSAITLTGANPAAFAMASNCSTVAAGATCTVWLTFGPTSVAAMTANLNITNTGPSSPLVVTLTGTGAAAAAGTTNVAPVVVDRGPMPLLAAGEYQINQAFTTVTICTPGSTSNCQVIDHVLIDTGSTGLQIMASALAPGGTTPSGGAVPVPLTIGGNALRECHFRGSGYTWGSMVTADVILGGYTVSSLPVALIGDTAAGSAPSDCAASANNLSAVTSLGVNGILGIAPSSANVDCPTCVAAAQASTYYNCPSSGSCVSTAVPLASQITNPVTLLPNDNNGVVVTLNAPLATGSQSVTGTLTFGINTESNNALGSTSLLAVAADGGFSTVYNGATYSSYLVSSAVANFFYNTSINECADYTSYYCPSPAITQTATLVDANNAVSVATTFTVDNADVDFTNYQFSALPGLSGLEGSSTAPFIWGIPAFLGRSVFLLYTGQTVAGVTGPAIGLQ